ncbi:MAG: hypothetical protein Fur0040_08680 [Sideroxydans sp.]
MSSVPVTDKNEIKRARLLHGVLLFDFIVIHVFYFVLAIGLMSSSILPLALMPVISLLMLSFVLWRAYRGVRQEPSWFVRCHLLLAAKRAKMFMLLFIITGTFSAGLVFGGAALGLKPLVAKSLAFGLGQLPFMVALLTLVVFEYDAEHQASQGKVPKSAVALQPAPEETAHG